MMVVQAIDPLKDAKKITVGAINSIAKEGLGSVLGPVLSDDLVNLLGLGSSTPDYTAYFEHLEKGIAAIQGQLQSLQQAVAQIQRLSTVLTESELRRLLDEAKAPSSRSQAREYRSTCRPRTTSARARA